MVKLRIANLALQQWKESTSGHLGGGPFPAAT